MTKKKLRIVFMGTPGFAVASLHTLLQSDHDIAAVVTMPDKPKGRGYKVIPSPVKEFALRNELTVMQPTNLKDPAFINELQALHADIFVVVAFRMLPEAVWNMPPLGTFNVHASLLPQYRGAAPINHAIINGETETGVTVFKLQHQIDTGDILLQKKIAIANNDTAGTLHDKLMNLGAEALAEALDLIATGKPKFIRQSSLISPGTPVKTAPKIFKADCRIDWTQPAGQLYNFIRGLSPYPAAYSHWSRNGKRELFKVYFASVVPGNIPHPPGTILTDNRKFLHIACGKDLLEIESIQVEGKKRMDIRAFLNGFDISGAVIID